MPLPKINEINTIEVQIPSSGTTIEMRPYYVKEERQLLNVARSEKSVDLLMAIAKLISSCVNTPGFDANTLTSFDIEYLFLKLRSISVGENAEVRVKCSQDDCGHTNQMEVDLSTVEVYTDPDHKSKIQITDNCVVEMAYPKPIDFARMMDKAPNQEDMLYRSVEACITKVYQDEQVFDQFTESDVTEFVNSLTQDQFSKLLAFVTTMPVVRKEVTIACEKCGRETSHTFEGMNDFFTLG